MGSHRLVRVFVPTFRRGLLLERALESLRGQYFSDWVCEVHNDDPTDTFPEELVRRIGDCRIELRQHSVNLGATRTFNLFFCQTLEPFLSILEDDNWWAPEFLEKMIEALSSYPEVTLSWCNQKIWQELPDGG